MLYCNQLFPHKEAVFLLDVTLLGTAALLPIPKRALTAAVLACAGRSILFDCGEGTQTAARKAGVSLMSADLIALTHYHGDHIFGLPGLLQTLGVQGRTEPLAIAGPPDIRAQLAPILQLAGWTPFPVTLLEMPPDGLPMRALHKAWPKEAKLGCFPTEHSAPWDTRMRTSDIMSMSSKRNSMWKPGRNWP